MSNGRVQKVAPWAVVPVVVMSLTSCGSSGSTTCGDYVTKSATQRLKVIDDWEPTLTDKQAASNERFLYGVCSNSDESDPGDRIEDMNP